MFIGQLRQAAMPSEKEEPSQTQKAPESQKSTDSTSFLQTREVKEFREKWAPTFTVRGVNDLLAELHKRPDYTSDKEVLGSAERILKKLGNKDGLQNFLSGLKAKPEGIFKTIGKLFGGG